METLQLKTLVPVHATEKNTPKAGATANSAVIDARNGFQTLLQNLIGLESVTDAPATTAARPAVATDNAEDDRSPVLPVSVSGDTPAPVIALPVALPPAAPVAVANSSLECPDDVARAKPPAALPIKLSTNAQSDGTAGTESPASALHAKTDATAAENTPPRFPGHALETRPGHPVDENPAHALEALAEHRDTAVGNVPLPQFTHGPHLQQPVHALPDTTAQIETPVGAAGWNQEFAQKIVWMAGEKHQAAELNVNPPDLGPLNIRLSIDENKTSAIFTSPHSEVREAIEAALPRLREVLADSGITLGNASVTSDSPRDGSAFDQQRRPLPAFADSPDADPATGAEASRAVPHRSGNGLVDLFA